MPKEKPQTPISAKLKNPPPKKPKNKDCRSREYLTQAEIDKLIKTARTHGRHRHRDATLILLMTWFKSQYECKQCCKRFDDLTNTVFSGHHQPLKTWIIFLYFMGLIYRQSKLPRN